MKPALRLVKSEFSNVSTKAMEDYRRLPRCNKCENSGFLDDRFCTCYFGQHQAKVETAWVEQNKADEEAARLRRLEREFGPMKVPRRFVGLSPATLREVYGPAATRGKAKAVNAAQAWAKGESEYPGLLLYGPTRTGKSALAWWAVQQRGWGLWVAWDDLLGQIQDNWEGRDAKIKAAQTSPVLFLDDLGDPWSQNSRVSDDRRRILFRIVNHRLMEELPTIITSNLDGPIMEKLTGQFDTRIAQRLYELCRFVRMGGINLTERRE